MSLQDYLTAIGDFILANLGAVVFSIIAIVAGYIAYKLIGKEINRLKNQKRIEESLAYTFNRIAKWIILAIVLSAILAQFGATIGLISGLLTILGGTVIGFAAINTIGNALAGLIVMTSRPFIVGDRIFFNGQFADVVAIDLIYTKMLTLDNVLVSIPNQELLKAETDNYGKKRVIRRHCTVTPGFEYDVADVRKALLEAAGKVQGVLQEPKPYVWVTKFQNYAVEYTLYVFISDIKRLPEIDADLHEKVFDTCKEHKIDISTPLLLKQMKIKKRSKSEAINTHAKNNNNKLLKFSTIAIKNPSKANAKRQNKETQSYIRNLKSRNVNNAIEETKNEEQAKIKE